MRALSNILELLGLVLVGVALYLFDWRLALAYAGALLVLAGFVLDGLVPRRAAE